MKHYYSCSNAGLSEYNARYQKLQAEKMKNRGEQATKKTVGRKPTVKVSKDVKLKDELNTRSILEKIAKIGNVDIVVERFTGADEKAEGYCADGVIHLNANKADFKYTYVAIHEAVHHIRDNNPEGYKVLEQYITNYLTKKGVYLNNRIKEIQASRKKHGHILSHAEALEELVCNSLSDISTDEAALEAFLELSEAERKTLRSILSSIVKSLRAWANEFLKSNPAHRALIKDAETLQTLAKELNKQLKVAGQNKNTTYDSGVRYSLENNIVDLSDDNELSKRVQGIYGSKKYIIIQEYILDVLGNQQIMFSDGKKAIVDRKDALHIANKSANRKTAEISKIKRLIETAKLYAEDTEAKHNKFNYFCYYKVSVKYKNNIYDLYINVGKAINDGKYHIYDITKNIKDTANRINGLERPKPNEGYALQNGISKNIIPNIDESVNKKNYSYNDTEVDLWELLDSDEDTEKSEYLQGYIDTADKMMELTRGVKLENDTAKRVVNSTLKQYIGKYDTQHAEQPGLRKFLII